MISKWSNRLWKLWGGARELNYPRKHHCDWLSLERPDNRNDHVAFSWCHSYLPRYTIYHAGSADSKGLVHFRSTGKIHGINGICEVSSSLVGTKWPVMNWHVGMLGLCY